MQDHPRGDHLHDRESAALRQLSRLAIDSEAPLEERICRLIDVGREYLGLPYGFLTEISEEPQESEGTQKPEGTQRIVYASGTHSLLQAGATCPLSEAYCRKTIQGESLLAIQNAPAEGWTDDPAYQVFKLGAYIGSKVTAGGELYGTFCFADSEPRSAQFSEREKALVELLTRWASQEIERRQDKRQLERQNERLQEFSSVLTHDLRNPLNVAQGRLSLAIEELGETGRLETEAPCENAAPKPSETTAAEGGRASEETANRNGSPEKEEEMPLGHLRAARRALGRIDTLIEDVLALTWGEQDLGAEDLEEVSLRHIAEECWQQVQAPEATLQVEEDRQIWAHPSRLRRLLENLFCNAAQHGGNAVSVTVGALPGGFFVEDDGPGIPEGRRGKVFERGFSSEEEGTGLGLSIAEAIARAHEWSLAATEGRAGGARFEITGAKICGT